MTIPAFKRTVRIATMPRYEGQGACDVFAFIQWDGDKLSLTGVEGPRANGDAHGSCGQIDGHAWDNYTARPGIDLDKLREVWHRWHLNDMRAGCEHQRALGWGDGEPIEMITYQLTTDAMMEGHRIKAAAEKRLLAGETVTLSAAERDLATLPFQTTKTPDADGPTAGRYDVKSRENKAPQWVREDEHPRGVLCKPCPVCGYKYGSRWLREEVPADVLEWLQSLPDGSALCPTRWLRD